MAGSAPRAAAIDGVAISLSSLCLIHCLILPILSASLPSIVGMWAEAEWLHKSFVVAALPFALIAFLSDRATLPIRLLIAVGYALLVAGAFYEPLHDHEVSLTVAGGLLLASGHAWRWLRAYKPGEA
ncbi:MAG: MerC domain-containing protein [Pseudomonadota bacterium]